VRFVRLRLLSAQGDSGTATSRFIDFTELAVYGQTPNVLPAGRLALSAATTAPGDDLGLDASSFTDPDSAITGYEWDFDGDGSTDRRTDGPLTTFAYTAVGTFRPRVLARDFRGGTGSATAEIRVSTGAADDPRPAAKARPRLVVPGRAGRARVTIRVTCRDACRVGATLTVDRATQRRLGLRRRTVGTLRTRTVRGTRRVTVSVSRTAVRALRRKRQRGVRVALRASAHVPGGPRTRVAKRVRVTR
jgi:hypothetical protein